MRLDKANEQNPQGLVSRRTLVKGAAWSVPTIAIATALPSVSASVPAVGYELGMRVESCNSIQLGNTPRFVIQNSGTKPSPAGKQVRVTFGGLPGLTVDDFALSGVGGSLIFDGSVLTAILPEIPPGGQVSLGIGSGGVLGVQAATFMTAHILDTHDGVPGNDAVAYGFFGFKLAGQSLGFCSDVTNDQADLVRPAVPWDFQIRAVCNTGAAILGLGFNGEVYFTVKNVSNVTAPAGEKLLLKGTGAAAGTSWTISEGSGGGFLPSVVGVEVLTDAVTFTLPEMPPGKEVRIYPTVAIYVASQYVLFYAGNDTNASDNYGAAQLLAGIVVTDPFFGKELGRILACAGTSDGVAA